MAGIDLEGFFWLNFVTFFSTCLIMSTFCIAEKKTTLKTICVSDIVLAHFHMIEIPSNHFSLNTDLQFDDQQRG